MKRLDWARLLEYHPILSSLPEEGRQWLLRDEVSAERSYETGAVVVRHGEVGDSIFLTPNGK